MHNKGTRTTQGDFIRQLWAAERPKTEPTRTTAKQGGEIVVGLRAKIHRSAESTDLHNRVESAVECSKGMPREMKLDRTTKMAKAGQRRKKAAAEKLGIRAIGLKLHEQPYDYEKALADVPTEADGLLIPMDSIGFGGRSRRIGSPFAKATDIVDVGDIDERDLTSTAWTSEYAG